MVRDINDLADERTMDIQSVGEQYHDDFLLKRPKGEWAPYLDETAKDLSAGIGIGDLALSTDDFGDELGGFYRRGLETSVGRYADLPQVLERQVSDRKLGLLAYQLNELSYDISTTGIDIVDVQEATEAVVDKLLTRHAGSSVDTGFDLAGGTVTDITTQLFKDETIAANVDTLLEAFEANASKGLLALLDEPQMMTPLWAHQRDALANWVEHDRRGYVDMATATGKTVLGLAALALLFGELHPDDQDLGVASPDPTGSSDVLIVAHSDLILEQWRREFDRHLNIPQERTTGGDDITLAWGTVHFRTPQALVNQERVDYDLVLLDEAHHYATGSEWGSLLDAFDGDVLAMSGSVDDAGSDSQRIKERLANSIGPEVKRYTITDAKADAVIPSFDWEVHYAPYDAVGDDLAKTARRAEASFSAFTERLESGELDLETDRRLRTYEDVRRFSHTTEGNELKQRDEAFRDLVTRLFSRRTKQWNLSPVLDSVVDLVVEHSTTENVVVLADSNAQVEELDSRLHDVLAESTAIHRVANSQSRSEQREVIDAFDQPESAGVLLGTGDLLGEGVDMQHAAVAVNMATGGVNPELVQRIGRVLRNPASTPKHAMFYNVVGVPPTIDAAVPREDGKGLVEQAATFCALGGRFDKLPGFAAADALDRATLGTLLEAGTAFVDELDAEGRYDWAQDNLETADLKALLAAVREHGDDVDATLGAWEEYAWEHSATEAEPADSGGNETDPGASQEDETPTAAPDEAADDSTTAPDPAVRERVTDIVRLQPAEIETLRIKWGLGSKRETTQYLQGELGSYQFRDGDGLVWASDEAEALVDATAQDDSDSDSDTQPSADPSNEELVNAILALQDSLGTVPTKAEMETDGEYAVDAFEDAFGTWSDAVRAAGLEPHGAQSQEYTREAVVEGLEALGTELEAPPSVSDINDHAPFSASVVYNFFDSLRDARVAAGVDSVSETEPTEYDETDEKDLPEETAAGAAADDEPAADNEPEADDGSSTAAAGSVDQAFFWDRDVSPITEYSEETSDADVSLSGSSLDDIDKKIDEWKSQLLDLTRRNKLIAFKPTKSKSLPFDDVDPTTVAGHLDDGTELAVRKRPLDDDSETPIPVEELDSVETDDLVPTRETAAAANSLSQIRLNNKKYLREQGVDALYLSLGMLRWYSVDYSDEANRSPLFLAPVELAETSRRDADRHDYVLKPKAEGLRLNPALRKKLAAERGLELPADGALSLEAIDAAFESVYDAVQGFDRWTIQSDVVLGIFDFTKFSLYSDLERNRAAIKSDPVIRALNGDTDPILESEGAIRTPSAAELDDVVDPIDTYQVLEADSSQQEAIEAAKRGKSFVLQGPPGTGKSQTIANIIAEKLAAGERVLFVSEKQAALNVVKNRLDDVGIGRFCLEVHGEKANNTDVLASLGDELKAGQVKQADERASRLKRLRERRDTLNAYGDLLFFSPPGWDRTAYQAFGIVSDHDDAPRIKIDVDDPVGLGESTLDHAIEELETLARYDEELDQYESSPWRHTTVTQWGVDTGDSMRQSIEQQRNVLAELQETADRVESSFGVRADSLAQLRDTEALLDHLRERPDIDWQEAFFDGSFAAQSNRLEEFAALEQERMTLVNELSQRYERSFFSADGAALNDELAGYGLLKVLQPSYRALKRRVTTHAVDGYDPNHEALLQDTRTLAEIQRIEDRRHDFQDVVRRLDTLYEGEATDWETLVAAKSWVADLEAFDDALTTPVVEALLAGELPDPGALGDALADGLARYDAAAAFFEDAMAVDELTVAGQPFDEASLSALVEELERLHTAVPRLQRRVQFTGQLETVRETVCGPYVERFLAGDYDAAQLVPAFEKRFFTEWLNAVYKRTALGAFSADEMERYVEEFRQLDEEQQELAKVEIQHEVTSRRSSLNLEHAGSSEQVLVRRETEKQRRHKPLRELFDEAGEFITRLTPCFMMSPLSVAQYLEAGSIEFDAVIFDEASQIMPQDAVSSLIRADQAIIAGDTKQLPPTAFFQSDVETTEDVREDLDSILEETASVLPEKDLRWHYRSRTSELIEFSNYHYYNNSLRTFPENDPDVETGVEFEYVEDGVYDRGGSRQNEVEAERVVDLIEEHARAHSEKSLGVVAFSSAQEQAIRDAIEVRREENAVLDAFVGQDDVLDEFFVKNLEMVQGDERDRMLFSVGYGPDRDGTISMNFGPLNKSGGERRLNVAVTRAKERVTVVSSIRPGEIDLTRTKSTGVAHFKNYLEYAQNGERALARDDSVTRTLDFDSRFEEAVYDALTDAGYDVVSQVESSSYSIDLAIKHPEQPGKFVLGIECDGAAYHSSKTARDRDRTRQLVLENLGWTIHRIWSPDWASNREHEIQKITRTVDSLLGGDEPPSSRVDVPSYEPEVVETGAKTDHEAITEYEEPSLDWDVRYSADAQGMATANRNSVEDTVLENGPIEYDTAIRTNLDVWSQSRAGKKVQRIFRNNVDKLSRDGKLVEHDGFLWPPSEDLEFRVRVNTDWASRSIDQVPVEEVALAITLVLEEGGTITEDDLVLEVTRLFGYQRRGARIEERIEAALDLLETAGVVDVGERIAIDTSVDAERAIRSQVYDSLPDPATADDGSESTSTAAETGQNTTGGTSIGRPDDSTFPFLASGGDGWRVPCPYCSARISNTRRSFVDHWGESDSCAGPESSPPSTATDATESAWAEILETVAAKGGESEGGDGERAGTDNAVSDPLDSERGQQLRELFEAHLARESHGDDWIDLTFEQEGTTDTFYQFFDGAHNLTQLDASQRAAADEVADGHDLEVAAEGENYVTFVRDDADPVAECRSCLAILESVYDVTLEDVEHAGEYGDGYEAW